MEGGLLFHPVRTGGMPDPFPAYSKKMKTAGNDRHATLNFSENLPIFGRTLKWLILGSFLSVQRCEY